MNHPVECLENEDRFVVKLGRFINVYMTMILYNYKMMICILYTYIYSMLILLVSVIYLFVLQLHTPLHFTSTKNPRRHLCAGLWKDLLFPSGADFVGSVLAP